jgi:ABC-2 type transport system ATP-binding protein
VRLRVVLRRAENGLALAWRRRFRAARQLFGAALRLLGGRPFHVTARHDRERTLARVAVALAVTGLAKRYGAVEALRGVDLEVREGELVGLLGPNGAGKSTLVKIACGLVRPTQGHAQICGAPAGSAPARRALGYLAELFRFPGWYTAEEVLELHQRLAGSDGGRDERLALLELVALSDARTRRVEAMSKGMQQRLGVAQALVGEPRLLLLDEPTSALDPVGRRTVRLLLEELRARGVAVLLNSHLLSEVELVCDRVAIMLAGRLVAVGTPDELARPRGVEIETDEGVELIERAAREDVPRLVEERTAAGRRIYGVRVLTSTLEEVYLETVGGATS